MTKPLSSDLRERLIEAVAARHEPAGCGGSVRDCGVHGGEVGAPVARHGQQCAAAAGWRQALRSDRSPCRGDTWAGRRDARHHAGGDCQPSGAAARRAVRAKHGLAVARSPRHDIQKKPRTPASRTGRTSPREDRLGAPLRQSLIRSVSSSSMRPARRPRWPALRAVAARLALPGCGPARSLEDDDIRRRPQARRHDGADGARWCYGRAGLPDVDRADAGSDTRARRHRRDGQPARPQAGRRARWRSRPQAPHCAICRHTRQISTRSRWHSPSSRHS